MFSLGWIKMNELIRIIREKPKTDEAEAQQPIRGKKMDAQDRPVL